MEWYLSLALIVGLFLTTLLIGMPVAFSFLFVNLVGAILWWGGLAGLRQLVVSIAGSVTTFSLMPVPMFILMGEVIFHSGMAQRAMDILDEWMGRLKGRLALLAVAGGALFATLSGSAVSGTAMLGSTLVPEMEKRGYKKPMSLGPILGSGGLAIMIPPSALGILLACLANISVGGILIAIIFPGLLMATLYTSYIIIRCHLQPSLAPSYEKAIPPLSKRLAGFTRYILPLSVIVFLVTGVIFLGLATPSEAGALGALGTFVMAAFYKRLNWRVIENAIGSTTRITVMMFMIFTGSMAFSQILAFTGATVGLCKLATGFPISPMAILAFMQLVLLAMGTFMEPLSIMMVALPVYLPIVHALHFNPMWFGVIMLLNMEMATTTPPFGLSLFVMKGVASPDTTMKDIYLAGLPFLGCDLIAMLIIMLFPSIALWLPSHMAIC